MTETPHAPLTLQTSVWEGRKKKESRDQNSTTYSISLEEFFLGSYLFRG